MLDLLGRIFATPKSIEKTVDAVIATGDKLVYTKEERAEDKQILQEWYLRYLEATQPQNLARRLLALMIGFLWVLLILLGVGLGLFTGELDITPMFDLGENASAIEAVQASTTRSGYVFAVLNHIVNQPFTAVVVFYFGGHYLKEVLRERKKG